MTRNLCGIVIITYRCNARYNMCDCSKCPTKPEEEITPNVIGKPPEMVFTNIIGGEPFICRDISDVVRELYKKSNCIVVSTNGYLTDHIIDLCREFPKAGTRINIEDLRETNDRIHGIPDGFSHGYQTLTALVRMGHPDAGFGVTVQDMSYEDLVPLYRLSDQMRMEFATAALHNSFHLRKNDSHIEGKKKVAERLEQLIYELLKSSPLEKWFRVYSNHGLISYIYRNPRLLTCDMSRNVLLIDPFRDVVSYDGMCRKVVMGNLKEQEREELRNSEQAKQVKRLARECRKSCWTIGSTSPAMHRYIWVPAWWVMERKFLKGGRCSLDEDSSML